MASYAARPSIRRVCHSANFWIKGCVGVSSQEMNLVQRVWGGLITLMGTMSDLQKEIDESLITKWS